MFDHLSLIDHFNLDRAKVQNFLIGIEEGYDCSIAYHNRAHAASVLHFTYALLVHGGVADAVSYPDCDKQLILLACLLAAAIHDFEHEGLSNDFLVKTGAERAVCYNDRSVNENHHAAAAFALMQHPDNNFLSGLSPVHYRRLRSIVVELVLGTDAAEGNKFLKVFTEHLDAADKKTIKTPGTESPYMPTTAQETTSALQIMLKFADLGHLALEWDAHVAWVERLETEFFAQGDMEKTLEFPEISFLMDRDRPGVSKTQTGFFQFVVVPLFTSLVRAFPAATPMLEQVERNFESWRDDEDARKSLNRRATM
jgi:cAMP-specific phosphodiesterase 4/calcium/calmodulin-dependent 3',5'-cyclic nucleotide phosphodiesterase